MFRVGEFDLLANAKLDCVLSQSDSFIEAAEVQWKLAELTAAMDARISLEGE